MKKKNIKKSTKENHDAVFIPTNSFDDVIKCEEEGRKMLWPTLNGLTPKKGTYVIFGLNGTDYAMCVGKTIKANRSKNPFPHNKHTNTTWTNKGDANGMLIIELTGYKIFKKSELKENGADIVKGRKQYITVPGIKMWLK